MPLATAAQPPQASWRPSHRENCRRVSISGACLAELHVAVAQQHQLAQKPQACFKSPGADESLATGIDSRVAEARSRGPNAKELVSSRQVTPSRATRTTARPPAASCRHAHSGQGLGAAKPLEAAKARHVHLGERRARRLTERRRERRTAGVLRQRATAHHRPLRCERQREQQRCEHFVVVGDALLSILTVREA